MSDLRAILHSAHVFIRGVESNKAVASLTFDHLIQEQIDSIKKGSTRDILDARGSALAKRVSKIDQLEDLERNLDAVVQAIQNAGDDQDKLRDLGIVEVDEETRSDDDVSVAVEERT